MTPRYGRAIGGARAITYAPYQRGNHMAILSAISLNGIEAALYGEWSVNGDIFNTFIEHSLCPNLKPGNVVVMDNVSFHKSDKVIELVEKCGAQVIFLPPYSPELNPIEEMWSKIKTSLRKESARCMKTFKKAIKKAYYSVTCEDIGGWFRHAGYCVK